MRVKRKNVFYVSVGIAMIFGGYLWVNLFGTGMNLFDIRTANSQRTLMQTVRTSTTREVESKQTNADKNYTGIHEISVKQVCSSPVQNIAFIKTHKTASSTVQNVILRYADNNDLKIAFTKSRGDLRFRYPEYFRKEYVRDPSPPGQKYKIVCHHMRFNCTEVQKILEPGTPFFTILREPAALFESIYRYFHNDVPSFRRLPGHHSIENWLDRASSLFINNVRMGKSLWHFAKSATFFDLGYDNLNEDPTYIGKSIKEIESTFRLVLVAEYFEESMLLLKELMCWTMEDIVHLKINQRARDGSWVGEKLTSSVAEKIRSWNKADAALYDYFNATLWKKIDKFGRGRMEKEKKVLKSKV